MLRCESKEASNEAMHARPSRRLCASAPTIDARPHWPSLRADWRLAHVARAKGGFVGKGARPLTLALSWTAAFVHLYVTLYILGW